MNEPIVVSDVLKDIAAKIAGLPGSEDLLVFGSASTLSKRPSDIDVVLWAASGLSEVQRKLARKLMVLANQHYGWLDVFVWDGKSLHVRNDTATAYVFARRSRELLKAIKTDGKPLSEVMTSWNQ